MIPRVLLPAVLSGVALLSGPGEPVRDPFLAAFEGRSGAGAVEAPGFDAFAEAAAWTLRPRREIVDGLAAAILRGERPPSDAPAAEDRPAPERLPADFDPDGVPVTDRLAAWVPADAAALLLPSLREGEDLVEGLSKFLPRALPESFDDDGGGRREALRRAVERLLLPVVWGANPNVRTGTRQVAVVAADPDLRWGADVALLAEVDDASLVRFHRQSSMRWEGRGVRVLRVDGLDAVSDDGSIRSFFGMRGGVAVWATTRDLRDRVLAAGEGRADSLLRPDPRAWALARRTFPAAEGGALLVAPDAFLARADSAAVRAKRAAALRCGAMRLLLDARSLAGAKESAPGFPALACPAGGVLHPVAGGVGSSCSVHGTAADPVPLGDLPPAGEAPCAGPSPALAGIPVAVRYAGGDAADLLVPPGEAGAALLDSLRRGPPDFEEGMIRRRTRIALLADGSTTPETRLGELTGLEEWPPDPELSSRPVVFWDAAAAPPPRPGGGPVRFSLRKGGDGRSSGSRYEIWSRILEWR